MDWLKYYRQFRKEAQKAGHDDQYIKRCLAYAKVLHQKNIPIIYDQEHLSRLVGYTVEYLRRASNAPEVFYRRFKIPKRSGGLREIAEPLPSLKEIQRWILDNILYSGEVSRFAKAFIKQRSIRDNARFHRKQQKVLSLDITDFFSSISSARVYVYFEKLGYCRSVATMLTNLCTLDNCLPQGAPTSPALSNVLSLRLDKRIAGFSIKYKLRYTRYADDITLSGTFKEGQVIRFVTKILNDDGLHLNMDKTKLMRPHIQQEVTGIIVNEKMQAPRKIRRNLRQTIYYIEKYGLGSHMEMASISKVNHVNHLRGIANYILFVNPKDSDAKHALQVLATC